MGNPVLSPRHRLHHLGRPASPRVCGALYWGQVSEPWLLNVGAYLRGLLVLDSQRLGFFAPAQIRQFRRGGQRGQRLSSFAVLRFEAEQALLVELLLGFLVLLTIKQVKPGEVERIRQQECLDVLVERRARAQGRTHVDLQDPRLKARVDYNVEAVHFETRLFVFYASHGRDDSVFSRQNCLDNHVFYLLVRAVKISALGLVFLPELGER